MTAHIISLPEMHARISVSADLEMAASCLAEAARKMCAHGLPIDPTLHGVLMRAPDYFELVAARISAPALGVDDLEEA